MRQYKNKIHKYSISQSATKTQHVVCFWKEDRRIMERVNPHNPPNGQGMPHQSPLAPTLLPLLVTRWGSWAGWGKPQQLKLLISWGFPHLTPPRGSQRATGHWQLHGYSFGVVNDTANVRSPIIYLIIIAIMMHLIIITIMMHWIIITIMMYHHNFPLFTSSLFTFHLSPP